MQAVNKLSDPDQLVDEGFDETEDETIAEAGQVFTMPEDRQHGEKKICLIYI